VTLTASMMKDNVGYTPYEGMRVKGWPTTVVSRGRIVVEGGELQVARGSGEFIPRGVPEPVRVASVATTAGRPGLLGGLLGPRR
jgi:dihydropyrimidinase